MKNPRSEVHATISAIGNRKIRTRWNATKSFENGLTTMNSPFFPFLFPYFLHNDPYINLFIFVIG